MEAKKDNGARVSQYDYNGNKNQLWNFCDPKDITSSSDHNDWFYTIQNYQKNDKENHFKYFLSSHISLNP